MSDNDPGVLHDATNSWNGYNHQGKIALWYAITQLSNLYDTNLSDFQNIKNLDSFFIELEYMEDFSIGQVINGKLEYSSVHQVKNKDNSSIKDYESALLGLAMHFKDNPSISKAYLHVTTPLNLGNKSLLENIQDMTRDPKSLCKTEHQIITCRNDPNFRDSFIQKKPGRPSSLKCALKAALAKIHPDEKNLTSSNIDAAFDALLDELSKSRTMFSSISDSTLEKIQLFTYNLNNVPQQFCKEDQADILLKSAISNFFLLYSPNSYKSKANFVEKCYLYMMGKLDQHIVDRALNYSSYKKGTLARQISFSELFKWLISDQIDSHDDYFYLFHIKENIFKNIRKYCKRCHQKSTGHCTVCQIPNFIDSLGKLSFKQLKEFLRITNPQIADELNMNTFGSFADAKGLNNPFLISLRTFKHYLTHDDGTAISYRGTDHLEYALTTIAPEGTDDDNAIICSEIIRNNNIYGLLMDYDCLISKDISVNSIQDENLSQNINYDPAFSEHIAHCKDTKIVPLTRIEAEHIIEEG